MTVLGCFLGAGPLRAVMMLSRPGAADQPRRKQADRRGGRESRPAGSAKPVCPRRPSSRLSGPIGRRREASAAGPHAGCPSACCCTTGATRSAVRPPRTRHGRFHELTDADLHRLQHRRRRRLGRTPVLAFLLDSTSKRHNILLVFAGFAIGWVSATIARYVYPPPKKPRGVSGDTP
jgi:hypothetical protein